MADQTPAQKTPAGKMRCKPGMSAALLHIPEGLMEVVGLPAGVEVTHDPAAAAGAGFVLEFAASQAEAEERLTALRPALGPQTVAWLAYPKGSRAAGHDLNRDTIWRFAQTVGLTLVANVAIDATWSAVRFKLPE